MALYRSCDDMHRSGRFFGMTDKKNGISTCDRTGVESALPGGVERVENKCHAGLLLIVERKKHCGT